jgi:hypothetical protein
VTLRESFHPSYPFWEEPLSYDEVSLSTPNPSLVPLASSSTVGRATGRDLFNYRAAPVERVSPLLLKRRICPEHTSTFPLPRRTYGRYIEPINRYHVRKLERHYGPPPAPSAGRGRQAHRESNNLRKTRSESGSRVSFVIFRVNALVPQANARE